MEHPYLLTALLAIVLYAGLYMSNPLAEPIRAGFVALSQIPVVVIFGTKNNLVGMLIGFGYERVRLLPSPRPVFIMLSLLTAQRRRSSITSTGSQAACSSSPRTFTPLATVSGPSVLHFHGIDRH